MVNHDANTGYGSSPDEVKATVSTYIRTGTSNALSHLSKGDTQQGKNTLDQYIKTIELLKTGFEDNEEVVESVKGGVDLFTKLKEQCEPLVDISRGLSELNKKSDYDSSDLSALDKLEKRVQKETPDFYELTRRKFDKAREKIKGYLESKVDTAGDDGKKDKRSFRDPQEIDKDVNGLIVKFEAGERSEEAYDELTRLCEEIGQIPTDAAVYNNVRKKINETHQIYDRRSPFNKLIRSFIIRIHEKRSDISEEIVHDYVRSKEGVDIDEQVGKDLYNGYVSNDEKLDNFIATLDEFTGIKTPEYTGDSDKKEPKPEVGKEETEKVTKSDIDDLVARVDKDFMGNDGKSIRYLEDEANALRRKIQDCGDNQLLAYFTKELAYSEEKKVLGLIESYKELLEKRKTSAEIKPEEPPKPADMDIHVAQPDKVTSTTPPPQITAIVATRPVGIGDEPEERKSAEEELYMRLRSNIIDSQYQITHCDEPDEMRNLLEKVLPAKREELNDLDKEHRQELNALIKEASEIGDGRHKLWTTQRDLGKVLNDAFDKAKRKDSDLISRDIFIKVLEDEIKSKAIQLKYGIDGKEDSRTIRCYDADRVFGYVEKNLSDIKEKVRAKVEELYPRKETREEKENRLISDIMSKQEEFETLAGTKRRNKDSTYWSAQLFSEHYNEIRKSYSLIRVSLREDIESEELTNARSGLENLAKKAEEQAGGFAQDTSQQAWEELAETLKDVRVNCDIYLGFRAIKDYVENWDEFGGGELAKNRLLELLFKDINRDKIREIQDIKVRYEQIADIAYDNNFKCSSYFNRTRAMEAWADLKRAIPTVERNPFVKQLLEHGDVLSQEIARLRLGSEELFGLNRDLISLTVGKDIAEDIFESKCNDIIASTEKLDGLADEDKDFKKHLAKFRTNAINLKDDSLTKKRRAKLKTRSLVGTVLTTVAATAAALYLGLVSRPAGKVDDSELLQARNRIATLDDAYKKSEAGRKTAEEKATQSEKDIEAKVNERTATVKEDLDRTKKTLKEERKAYAEEDKKYLSQIDILEKGKKAAEQRIAKLEADTDAAIKDELTNAKKTLEQERKDNVEENEKYQNQIAALEGQVAALEANIGAEVNKRTAAVQDELANAKRTLEEKRKADAEEDEKYQNQIAALRRKLESVKVRELTPKERADIALRKAEEKIKGFRKETAELDPGVREFLEKMRRKRRGK